MTDDGSNVWTRGDFSAVDEFGNEDMSIDVDTLYHILDEPQPLQVVFGIPRVDFAFSEFG